MRWSFGWFLAFIFLAGSSSAGQISDYFSEDIFGVQWHETVQTVHKQLGRGDLEEKENLLLYTILDGRRIFDVARKDTNRLSFIFNLEGILVGASAEFSADEEVTLELLKNRLDETFGPANMNANQQQQGWDWPNDNGYFMTLSPFVYQAGKHKTLLTVLRH